MNFTFSLRPLNSLLAIFKTYWGLKNGLIRVKSSPLIGIKSSPQIGIKSSASEPIGSDRVVDPYSFFTDPDPDGGQYGSGSGSGSNPDPGL